MNNTLLSRMRDIPNRLPLMILATGLLFAIADASPFRRIVSFGDSLADTGNAFAATGGQVPPAEFYWEGRPSNGFVWVEYLAQRLDLDIDDYAFYGAMTDDQNFRDDDLGLIFPMIGLSDEIQLFLEDSAVDPVTNRDLFTLIIGTNDFFAFLGEKTDVNPIPNGIVNTAMAVQQILEAGARTLVVFNVPDISNTPNFGVYDPETRAWLSGFIAAYNAALSAALHEVASAYKCDLILVDTFYLFNDIIQNPADYGIDNITVPALYGLNDPETSLFWDVVHPTTIGHQFLADQVLETILDAKIPGQAISLDRNVPGWAK